MLTEIIEELEEIVRGPPTARKNVSEIDSPSAEERLRLYQRAEKFLREFFSAANFCLENCITQENSLYQVDFSIRDRKKRLPLINGVLPGRYGCCPEDFSDVSYLEKLAKRDSDKDKDKETISMFKRSQSENAKDPNPENEGCKYHSDKGCTIDQFTSPICLSYICSGYKSYLEYKFMIRYERFGTLDFLEGIILGKINEEEVNDLTITLSAAALRIINHEKDKSYSSLNILC